MLLRLIFALLTYLISVAAVELGTTQASDPVVALKSFENFSFSNSSIPSLLRRSNDAQNSSLTNTTISNKKTQNLTTDFFVSYVRWTDPHLSAYHKLLYLTCQSVSDNFNWSGGKKGKLSSVGRSKMAKALTHSCDYQPFLGTLALCLHNMAKDQSDVDDGFHLLSTSCPNITIELLKDSYENATKYRINEYEIKNATKLNVPVAVGAATFQKAYQVTYSKLYNLDYSLKFGYAILGYWLAIMVLSMFTRFMKATGIIKFLNNRVTKYFQANFFIPSLFHEKHFQPTTFFGFITSYLPTRSESCIILGYLLIHLIAFVCGYKYTSTSTKHSQMGSFVTDRAGILAFAHFPLIFLFGGRNNFLLSTTTFNYSTFIHFHKWTGRVMFLDAVIHGIGYTVLKSNQGSYTSSFQYAYYYSGFIAIAACAAIMILSYNFFRRRAYEFFLITHILLVLLFTIGVWRHSNQLGYMEFLIAAIAVWGFDRFIRIVRLFNFGIQKANVNILADGTMKIIMKRPSASRWKPNPGQFSYIYFFTLKTFWQSHPFTITDSVFNENEIIAYIKPKNGLTSKLATIFKNQNTILVSVEGPYGHSANNYHYDNINLLAGGNGIPGPFHHAVELAKRYPDGQKNNIRLIWVARDLDSITWFKPELKYLINTPVQVILYLTREKEENIQALKHCSLNSIESEDKCSDEKLIAADLHQVYELPQNDLNDFEIVCGRPDFDAIIRNWFTTETGTISITACGPNLFCDNLRKSISTYIEDHDQRVDYNEELQMW